MCFTLEKRQQCTSVLGNMDLDSLFVDDVGIWNCDLTHGRYVIGGGTGELPSNRNDIPVLGCVAC